MLQQKAKEAYQVMAKLKEDREKVNKAHNISAEEETVKGVRSEAMALVVEAQEDLDMAMLLLHAAREAPEDLKTREPDLSVTKTFVKPLPLVVEAVEAACLLGEIRPDRAAAKSLTAQPDFFTRFLDGHNQPVSEATFARIRQMGADPRSEMKKVMCVSESTGCLFKRVVASAPFGSESQKVAPKQRETR